MGKEMTGPKELLKKGQIRSMTVAAGLLLESWLFFGPIENLCPTTSDGDGQFIPIV